MSTILVTGAAGFIGMHLARRLLELGHQVIGIDNINEYYDVELKKARISILCNYPGFSFIRADISKFPELIESISALEFDVIIHLAAQAGVRYSIVNPRAYLESNLVGFFNILELSRIKSVGRVLYASSSSVYGESSKVPFEEADPACNPVSFYAATKRSNELMAYSYAKIYNLDLIGLRFFTVYGSWGRPDMAYFSFTNKIFSDTPIELFNHGKMLRDFTHIEDIIKGIVSLVAIEPAVRGALGFSPVFNIGGGNPVPLLDFISTLEEIIGKRARIKLLPMQSGDVSNTFASTQALERVTSFIPSTPLKVGLSEFVSWYKYYYKLEDTR